MVVKEGVVVGTLVVDGPVEDGTATPEVVGPVVDGTAVVLEVGPVVDEPVIPLVEPSVDSNDGGIVLTVVETDVLGGLVDPEVLDTMKYIYINNNEIRFLELSLKKKSRKDFFEI